MAKISLIVDEERTQIAEHAFRAGFKAALGKFSEYETSRPWFYLELTSWNEYEPESSDDR